MKKFIVAGLVSLFFMGCGIIHTSFAVTTSQPAYTGTVKVLDSPPDNFVEIGWITCQGDFSSTWLDFLQEAKNEASQYGANAIIFTPDNAKEGSNSRRSLLCKAIYYKE